MAEQGVRRDEDTVDLAEWRAGGRPIAGLRWDPERSVHPKAGDRCDVLIPAEITHVDEGGVSWVILPNRLICYRPLDERPADAGG